jgi:hypothetical protein
VKVANHDPHAKMPPSSLPGAAPAVSANQQPNPIGG